MCWGHTHEIDAQAKYSDILKQRGHESIKVTHSGLVIDLDELCLACSPDGLVYRPGSSQPLGVVEYKCPYNLAHAVATSQTAVAAAEARLKKFYCTLSESGEVQLKKNHDCYFQVEGILPITRYMWCDFVVWTPQGTSV